MPGKRIVIIGAGIAGLSAGCYARMNGFEVDVFERHSIAGGVCTGWRRDGYVIEGCVHHLAGCKPGTPLYRMWQELGAMPRAILYPEELTRIEDETGTSLTAYVDLDRLRGHLREIAPDDGAIIDEYIQAARFFTKIDLLKTVAASPLGKLALLPAGPRIAKWSRITVRQFAQRFSSPFLRKAFPAIQYDWPDTPMLLHLNMLGNCHARNYGFPVGGSLAFVRSIAQRLETLGGRIHYRSPVEEIQIEGQKAIGVRLADGSEYPGDFCIATCYPPHLHFDLLGGRLIPEPLREKYARISDEMVMGLHISFGVNRDFSDEPHAMTLFLEHPVRIADRDHDRLDLELFAFDHTLADTGKAVIKVIANSSYQFWKKLYENPKAYQAAKQEAANNALAALESRFPRLSRQIEMTDIATPVTTERFTVNGPGFGDGLDMSVSETIAFLTARPSKAPFLENCYTIGQWYGGAGIPGCAAMGRNAVRRICRQTKQRFQRARSAAAEV